MSNTLRYHTTASLPSSELWLLDDDGTLIDFATGYTFSLKIGHKGSAAILTKTTGITGATGAGVEPTGTANIVVAWDDAEFGSKTPGPYTWQLKCTATSGGKDRVFEGRFELMDVIT
jgi:hypothetical protein